MEPKIEFDLNDLANFDRKIKKLIRKMNYKTTQKIFETALEPYEIAVQANAPESSAPHTRKNEAGDVVATYYPGNLKRSFKRLKLRRIRRAKAILFGPRRAKVTTGDFKSVSKSDGWYAHLPHEGYKWGRATGQRNPYAERAWNSTGGIVKTIATQLIKKEVLSV